MPQKGLFSLPFMARAAERQNRAAAAEAASLLRDIERDELATGASARGGQGTAADGALDLAVAEEVVGGSGRRQFGGTVAAQHAQLVGDSVEAVR